MKKVLIILLFFCSANFFSQSCLISNGDSLNTEVGRILMSDKFYTYYGTPFIDWKEKPEKFYFALFDRWGLKVTQSNDPDYILDGIKLKDSRLNEGSEYYFVIEFKMPGLKRMRYSGQLIYSGFYRCG